MTQKKYLLRKTTGDLAAESEQEIREWFKRGQCKPSDSVFDFSAQTWSRAGDLPALADIFGPKPVRPPEKKLIYFVQPGGAVIGPLSMPEIQARVQARELSEATWVFVEGDKEWRPLKSIKVLLDLLPAHPADKPVPPVEAEVSQPSIRLDVAEDAPSLELGDQVEQEEATMAFSTLGLSSLKVDHSAPSVPSPAAPSPPPASAPSAPPRAPTAAAVPPGSPSRVPAPPAQTPSAPPGPPRAAGLPPAPKAHAPAAPGMDRDQDSFDGITAEIPIDPIWLLKRADSEAVSGPFPFLEVIKFLKDGRLTKNDKISKVGTNRFVKIQQQYEFNVTFAVESVVEHGVEKQKILIKRRHPRVPYFSGVQLTTPYGLVAGTCVNISAGGILVEAAKAEIKLGDIVDVKIVPGLVPRAISCRSLVIGKIPKMPPAFALKFEDLKSEDKEAIEFYVQETLKREMLKKS